MRKYHGIGDDQGQRASRSRAPMVILFLIVLLIAPFAYEGGSIVVARWQSMYGTYWEPRTPILNAISEWSATSNREVQRQFSKSFLNGRWSPALAIPMAITWAGLAAFFLRRGH
jgi:hypothetical protein